METEGAWEKCDCGFFLSVKLVLPLLIDTIFRQYSAKGVLTTTCNVDYLAKDYQFTVQGKKVA